MSEPGNKDSAQGTVRNATKAVADFVAETCKAGMGVNAYGTNVDGAIGGKALVEGTAAAVGGVKRPVKADQAGMGGTKADE